MSQEDKIQDEINTASLGDLPLTAEESDQTKAGTALTGEVKKRED